MKFFTVEVAKRSDGLYNLWQFLPLSHVEEDVPVCHTGKWVTLEVFKTKEEAEDAAQKLRPTYPGA